MTETRPRRSMQIRRAAILAMVTICAVVSIGGDLPKTATLDREVAIKSGKSSLSPILVTVDANTTLTLLGESDSFVQVKTADGTVGYIMEDDLPRTLTAPKDPSAVPRDAEYGLAGRGLQDSAVNYAAQKKISKKTVAAVNKLKAMEDEVTDKSLQTFANEHHLGPKQFRAH